MPAHECAQSSFLKKCARIAIFELGYLHSTSLEKRIFEPLAEKGNAHGFYRWSNGNLFQKGEKGFCHPLPPSFVREMSREFKHSLTISLSSHIWRTNTYASRDIGRRIHFQWLDLPMTFVSNFKSIISITT